MCQARLYKGIHSLQTRLIKNYILRICSPPRHLSHLHTVHRLAAKFHANTHICVIHTSVHYLSKGEPRSSGVLAKLPASSIAIDLCIHAGFKRLTHQFLVSSRFTAEFFKFCSVGEIQNFSPAEISHGICLSQSDAASCD